MEGSKHWTLWPEGNILNKVWIANEVERKKNLGYNIFVWESGKEVTIFSRHAQDGGENAVAIVNTNGGSRSEIMAHVLNRIGFAYASMSALVVVHQELDHFNLADATASRLL